MKLSQVDDSIQVLSYLKVAYQFLFKFFDKTKLILCLDSKKSLSLFPAQELRITRF